MLSTGLWRWYINITITILNIIHRTVFHLTHNVSETEFYLRLQVEPTQLDTIDRARTQYIESELCLETETTSVYCAQLGKIHLKTETESSLRNIILNEWQDDG
jgi:hypothetical protein